MALMAQPLKDASSVVCSLEREATEQTYKERKSGSVVISGDLWFHFVNMKLNS